MSLNARYPCYLLKFVIIEGLLQNQDTRMQKQQQTAISEIANNMKLNCCAFQPLSVFCRPGQGRVLANRTNIFLSGYLLNEKALATRPQNEDSVSII